MWFPANSSLGFGVLMMRQSVIGWVLWHCRFLRFHHWKMADIPDSITLENENISSRWYGAKLFSMSFTLPFMALFYKLLYIFDMPLIPKIYYWQISCIKWKYQKVTMPITYETDQFYTNVQLNNCKSWFNIGMRTFPIYKITVLLTPRI